MIDNLVVAVCAIGIPDSRQMINLGRPAVVFGSHESHLFIPPGKLHPLTVPVGEEDTRSDALPEEDHAGVDLRGAGLADIVMSKVPLFPDPVPTRPLFGYPEGALQRARIVCDADIPFIQEVKTRGDIPIDLRVGIQVERFLKRRQPVEKRLDPACIETLAYRLPSLSTGFPRPRGGVGLRGRSNATNSR